MVDDEPGIRETLGAILRLQQYQVEVAPDGVLGYESARSFHPDLIISDVVMPERNGIELAILVAESMPGTGILLISGQAATAQYLQDARQRGYDFECLTKPVPPPELLKKVEELLRQRRSAKTGG